MKTNRVELNYVFDNVQTGVVEVWCALPPDTGAQTDVTLTWRAAKPDVISTVAANRIAYFRLPPGARIELVATASLAIVEARERCDHALSDSDRAWYLRSTPLCTITDEVRALAARVAADAPGDVERVRRLYVHMLRTMRYRWPPPDRGSESALRHLTGDCGDYSALFAAMCRSLGLPCRIMFGTWAHGKMQAHVWNEVFVDGLGWILVDTSGDQMAINFPLPRFVKWTLIDRFSRQVGCHNGSRLAFSIDPDAELAPCFDAQGVVPASAERFDVGGVKLAWGYELLDGKAPYLQPVYARFDGSQRLNKAQETLGVWEVSMADQVRLSGVVIVAGIAIGGVCGMALVLIEAPFWARLVAAAALLLATQLKPLWVRAPARAALTTFVLSQLVTRMISR
jgi:hypothetical protein